MNDQLEIFENVGDGAFALDLEQNIILWNHTAEKMLGYSAQEALGQKCWQLLRGTTLEGEPYCAANCPVIQQVRTGQPIRHIDLVVNGRSGQKFAINVSTLPVQKESAGLEAVSLVHLHRPMKSTCTSPLELQIFILGTFDVIRPDGLLLGGKKWQQSQARNLLACLLVHRGQPVSIAALHECLWPELPLEKAQPNLETAVSNLLRFLEPELKYAQNSQYIDCEKGFYRLKLDCVWLDVLNFEDHIQKGLRSYNPDTALEHYEHALALYQGEMLAGLNACSCWFQSEQRRLAQAHITALINARKLYEGKQDYLKAQECKMKLSEQLSAMPSPAAT